MSHLYQSVLTADNKASRSGNRYCKSQKIPKGPVTNRSIKKNYRFYVLCEQGVRTERRKRGWKKKERKERRRAKKDRCGGGKSDEKMCKPLEMSIPVFPSTSDRRQINVLPISCCPKASIRPNLTPELCTSSQSHPQAVSIKQGWFCCPQEI